MSRVLPWEPGYTSTVNEAYDVDLPPHAEPHLVPPPLNQPAPATVETPPDLSEGFGSALEHAVAEQAAQAARDALPGLKDAIVAAMTGAKIPALPDLSPQVLSATGARNAALRSLLYGLVISVLAAVGNAIADIPDPQFLTKAGLVSVISVSAGAALHAAMTYLGHLRWGAPSETEKAKLLPARRR